jgi:predicted NUDIX family NTP pyrophosphohydrolase
MSKIFTESAGMLLFRRKNNRLEIFLAHPGGPFWAKKDAGAWTIPKGLVNPGESTLLAACREFEEETGIKPAGDFLPLGSIRQKAGKTVHAWAWEGDADPNHTTSNLMKMEYPKGSGKWLSFPEVDRCAWFETEEAKNFINPAQIELIERLKALLQTKASSPD